MDQTFDTPEPVALFVSLGAGGVTVEAADTGESRVEIVGPRADEFTVELRGRNLAVAAPKGRFLGIGHDSHTVRVVVPTGSDLSTKTGSADTETIGSLGTISLKTGSGDVEVERADGPLVVDSGSGDIRCHEAAAEVRIKSGSGDVDLGDVRGTTGISTGSGDVVIGSVHERTVVKTGSGDLELKRTESDVSLTTASGDLVIGHAPRGRITAKNVSGDVRVGIPAGTPVWTDVNTVSGSVASDLQSAGKPADGQDYVELRASTVSGDVRLVQV
ncbi:MAG: DUF4097 family beta strand repeat protein [Propionibacteriales bacterium]|nr:DUF4097 family beta strand repeat protein [Propionibacteriales bacterium]